MVGELVQGAAVLEVSGRVTPWNHIIFELVCGLLEQPVGADESQEKERLKHFQGLE